MNIFIGLGLFGLSTLLIAFGCIIAIGVLFLFMNLVINVVKIISTKIDLITEDIIDKIKEKEYSKYRRKIYEKLDKTIDK